MDKGDRDAALAHRGGDALHGAIAHISTGEHAWHTGFDEIGVAALLPAARFDDVAASQNIATRVTRDFRRQLSSFGVRADEHEQSP